MNGQLNVNKLSNLKTVYVSVVMTILKPGKEVKFSIGIWLGLQFLQ